MAQGGVYTRKEVQCPLHLMDEDRTCPPKCPLYQEMAMATAATNVRMLKEKRTLRRRLIQMSERELTALIAKLKEANASSRENMLKERPELGTLCLREREGH